jgi:hypothetical protein
MMATLREIWSVLCALFALATQGVLSPDTALF